MILVLPPPSIGGVGFLIRLNSGEPGARFLQCFETALIPLCVGCFKKYSYFSRKKTDWTVQTDKRRCSLGTKRCTTSDHYEVSLELEVQQRKLSLQALRCKVPLQREVHSARLHVQALEAACARAEATQGWRWTAHGQSRPS